MLLGVRLDLLKDVLEGTWHYTLVYGVVWDTSNREGLTSTSLTVSKNGTIITLDDILTDREGRLRENFLLGRAVKCDNYHIRLKQSL